MRGSNLESRMRFIRLGVGCTFRVFNEDCRWTAGFYISYAFIMLKQLWAVVELRLDSEQNSESRRAIYAEMKIRLV